MGHNKIYYFLTLTKTFPNGLNTSNYRANRYTIREKFECNGFSISLYLDINITSKYIYQLKTIYINDKRSNVYQLLKVLVSKHTPAPMSEIWY